MVSMSRAMDLGRIGRETEDIAGPGHDLGAAPGLQHVAIFPDLVLPLLRAHERLGIDVLEADEHGVASGAGRLLDEARNAVAERVDLQQEPDLEALDFAQFDQAVEDRLPIAVAGEIVVGDEEARDALSGVGAHDRLDVVGGSIARLPPLDVDDGAEAALERAAAPGVEARVMSGHPRDDGARQHRNCRRRHIGHVVQVIVCRLGLAGVDIAQEPLEAAFALAGVKDHAERLRFLQVRRQFGQHGHASGDMEAADGDRHAASAKLAADVERTGKLIRLNADERDKAAAGGLDPVGNPGNVDDRVAFVIDVDLDIHVGTEDAFVGALREQAVDAGEAVRGDCRAPPLDDIAVVVVMRRLDQNDQKLAAGHRSPSESRTHGSLHSQPGGVV